MTIIEKLTKDVLDDEYFKLIFSKCSLISAEYNLKIELSDNILTNKELTDALGFLISFLIQKIQKHGIKHIR